MQEFSKEEFSLLNGGCDKDTTLTNTNDNTDIGIDPEAIKLEDQTDIYKWNSLNLGSNLL